MNLTADHGRINIINIDIPLSNFEKWLENWSQNLKPLLLPLETSEYEMTQLQLLGVLRQLGSQCSQSGDPGELICLKLLVSLQRGKHANCRCRDPIIFTSPAKRTGLLFVVSTC